MTSTREISWMPIFSLTTIIASLAVFLFQVYYWLKVGDWLPIPLQSAMQFVGLNFPSTSWLGIQKVYEYLYGAPLSVCILGVYFIGAIIKNLTPE